VRQGGGASGKGHHAVVRGGGGPWPNRQWMADTSPAVACSGGRRVWAHGRCRDRGGRVTDGWPLCYSAGWHGREPFTDVWAP
jgi:hypothetical protein